MNVKVLIRRGAEEYTFNAPEHSWLALPWIGSHPVGAPLTTRLEQYGEVTVTLEPLNPPHVPAKVLRLVNGRGPHWGRNGHEWTGWQREKQGARDERDQQYWP